MLQRLRETLWKGLMPRSDRSRWFIRNTGAAFGAKVLTAGCVLLQVPLAFKYLGPVQFGIWATLTNLLGLLNFTDLGIGYGIQNEVAHAFGRDDSARIAAVLRRGIVVLTAVALVVGVVLAVIIGWTPWTRGFARDPAESQDLVHGATILLVQLCINLPLTAFQRAATGLQRNWLVSAWTAGGNAVALGFIVLASRLHFGFAAFVLVAAAPTLAANLGLAYSQRSLLLRVSGEEPAPTALFRAGLPFVVPQLGALALVLAPPIIIASVAGPAAVANYTVVQRILLLFSQVQGLIGSTLWPAFTEARARGDHAWIVASYKRLWLFTLIAVALPQALFGLWGPWAVHRFVPGAEVPLAFAAAMGVQAALSACTQPQAMLLNSLGRVLGQATYGFAAVALIVLSLRWGLERWGLAGAPIVFIVWFGLISVPLVTVEATLALKRQGHTR